ncbi:MAG: HPr family phosphocarrier protein [Phycisphaerae bacterium]|nr:HPr family phosphocarrier protein [Phycisphaerae bacterium]
MAEEVRTVTTVNPQGLHARPVMRFVDLASKFNANVRVKKGDYTVDGKNPMEMMLLEASLGTQMELLVDGPDASRAVAALVALVSSGFGEM